MIRSPSAISPAGVLWQQRALDVHGEDLVEFNLGELGGVAVAALCDQHDVSWRPGIEPKTLLHPLVGRLELDCQTLIVDSESQLLLVHTATPGTESAERLRLLGVVGGQQFTAARASRPSD